MLRNAVGGGGGGCASFPGKKRYEGVRFNVISVTRGWVGFKFPGKMRYVTLECPLIGAIVRDTIYHCKQDSPQKDAPCVGDDTTMRHLFYRHLANQPSCCWTCDVIDRCVP